MNPNSANYPRANLAPADFHQGLVVIILQLQIQ